VSTERPANSPSTYAMLAAAAVIYGAIFTVNKLAAAGGVPPLAYSFWQSFGAGVVLWLVLTLNGERLGVTRQHLVGYIVIGALVIGIPITLLTYIAPRLAAGVMTLVVCTENPIQVYRMIESAKLAR
jgi:drug/metabolite transporter (DMT)-like permease